MGRKESNQTNKQNFVMLYYNVYQAPRYGCVAENYFSYFSTKTYVVGTQKNRLNETVLLSTQNKCLNWWIRK